MPLDTKVGLGPDHIVLDGDPALPQKVVPHPHFSTYVYCGQRAGWIKMPLGTEVGLGTGHIVLDGDPAPLVKKGHSTTTIVRPMSILAKRLNGSRCHFVRKLSYAIGPFSVCVSCLSVISFCL